MIIHLYQSLIKAIIFSQKTEVFTSTFIPLTRTLILLFVIIFVLMHGTNSVLLH